MIMFMKRIGVTALLLLCGVSGPGLADVTGPGGKVIDCYCTDTSGSRVELGETICLRVDGRMFMARCEMALNNPIWRDTGQGCVSSHLMERLKRADPGPGPGGVYPKI